VVTTASAQPDHDAIFNRIEKGILPPSKDPEEMRMKEFRNPHPPRSLGAYAHQIEVTQPQRWLVLSGQIGMHPDGTLPPDAEAQLEVALDNIARNLEAAGMGVADLVKLTFYLVEPSDIARRRQTLSKFLGDHTPA